MVAARSNSRNVAVTSWESDTWTVVAQPRPQRVAEQPLVGRVPVGVQQDDGDRLGLQRRDALGHRGGVLRRSAP